MPAVEIYVLRDGTTTFLRKVDEAIVSKHSKTIRDVLASVPPKARGKYVTLSGAAPAAVDFVIQQIVNKGSKLKIKIGKLPLERAVAIYEAVETLQVEPRQAQVEGHIVGFVAHAKVSPTGLQAVHKVFFNRQQTSKAWDTLVHHVGRSFQRREDYTNEEFDQLANVIRQQPTLYTAINAKIADLQQRKANYDAVMAKKKAATEAWEARKEARKAAAHEAAEASRQDREYRQRQQDRWWEEAHGLRPASEKTVDWILQEKVCYRIKDLTIKSDGRKASGEGDGGEEGKED